MVKKTRTCSENRFSFGKNWSRFLNKISEKRIADAESSLSEKLGNLSQVTFLDIGSGSGLFSLAANRLGAKVFSFDYDDESVECTRLLKKRYASDASKWDVAQGSVLDKQFISQIAPHDIVYSWGVLHHTGSMWEALDNAASLVKPGGLFYIAIYNDQGGMSRIWTRIKRLYNRSPEWVRFFMTLFTLLFFEGRSFLIQLATFRNPLRTWKSKDRKRGMDLWVDTKDWVGGYPFEVAKPEEIFEFCKKRHFELQYLQTNAGGIACNEYVFRRRKE